MKRTKISKLLAVLFIGGVLATSCNDAGVDAPAATEFSKGYITLDLSLAPETRATRANGESNNESTLNSIDLFFYDSAADEEIEAKFAKHETAPGSTISVSINELTNAFSDKSCKVIAVANCAATKGLTNPTINELKGIELSAKNTADGLRDFRSAKAPVDFVMTNFAQMNNTNTPNTVTWTDEEGSGTVQLKRVAAKIRVALNVEETIIDDEGKEWKADFSDMRLFINNGVTKGQLDGAHIELAEDDYYSIATSGSKGEKATETGAYYLARVIGKHEAQANGAPTDNEDYLYYNDIPYYTYPNKWTESMLETTQTMLTIVVPWEKNETVNGKEDVTEYRPSYYSIPVNNGTTIESNKYYYLRLHIGMMGSVTPEKPMEVPMQCEIAEWCDADATHANIRPVRYLNFNQTEFVMNNTNSITIPFSSTHECEVSDFHGQYYSSTGDFGYERTITFDDGTTNGKGTFYDYAISDNTIIFNHNFFDQWTPTISNEYVSSLRKGGKYFYSRFDIYITVKHGDIADSETVYQETIHIRVNPVVYISSERINSDGSPIGYGWIFVNGYGQTDAQTGNLGEVNTAAFNGRNDTDENLAILTFTVTQLDEEQKKKWTIDDPRTYFINNEMSNTSMATDNEDHIATWTVSRGPFDGDDSKFSGDQLGSGEVKTMWEHYPDVEDVVWSEGIWSAKEDQNKRALKYYYPCAEGSEKSNIISPKFMVASRFSRHPSASVSREEARRRCATFQHYGYPAGRWRLPTLAEAQYLKDLNADGIILKIFGGSDSWTNQGIYDGSLKPNDNTGYTRCVYDLWYWEKEDKKGNSVARIPFVGDVPEGSLPTEANMANFKFFTWGDRPKENPLTRGAGGNTVESFLQENAPGNYAVIRNGNDVKLEKME